MSKRTRKMKPEDVIPEDGYFMREGKHGLEIVYVTPCGDKLLAALVTKEEMVKEFPAVALIHPTLGLKGFIKIGKLLQEWLDNR